MKIGENKEGLGSIYHLTWRESSCGQPSVQVYTLLGDTSYSHAVDQYCLMQ